MSDMGTAVAELPVTLKRRLRWRVLLIALVLLIAVGVWRAVWWVQHPTLFPDARDNESGPATVSQPLFVGLTFPDDGQAPTTLHLESVGIGVRSDTSAARLLPVVCEAPAQAGGGSALGFGSGEDARGLCLHPVAAHNVTMTLGRGHQQYIVLEIVPTKPGTLTIDKFDLSYSHGLQDGTQTIGMNLTVNARR